LKFSLTVNNYVIDVMMTSRVNSAIFSLVMGRWGKFGNKNKVTSNRVSQCTE